PGRSIPAWLDLRESDLVAIELSPSHEWVALLEEIEHAGAAVLPVDLRLPEAEVERLFARARPTVVIDADGSRRVAGNRIDHDIGFVAATSGSRGEPRLVELTRAAVRGAVDASLERLDATAADP